MGMWGLKERRERVEGEGGGKFKLRSTREDERALFSRQEFLNAMSSVRVLIASSILLFFCRVWYHIFLSSPKWTESHAILKLLRSKVAIKKHSWNYCCTVWWELTNITDFILNMKCKIFLRQFNHASIFRDLFLTGRIAFYQLTAIYICARITSQLPCCNCDSCNIWYCRANFLAPCFVLESHHRPVRSYSFLLMTKLGSCKLSPHVVTNFM